MCRMPALPTPQITRYQHWLAEQRGLRFDSYDALWQWSIDELDAFWLSLWDYFGLRSPTPFEHALCEERMPGARWFEGASLNYAQQALRHGDAAHAAGHPAIVWANEAMLARGQTATLAWPELRRQVASLAASLKALGVQRGDRVVAYLPNIPETAIAFYACASIGAIWSSCSPDMGHASVLDRFRQIDPKLLLAVDGYRYGGRDFDRMDVVRTMREALPTLEHTVLLPYLNPDAALDGAIAWQALLDHPAAQSQPIRFEQLPFDHPLWILYSSGTTGMPKPIVHGHGGALIEASRAMPCNWTWASATASCGLQHDRLDHVELPDHGPSGRRHHLHLRRQSGVIRTTGCAVALSPAKRGDLLRRWRRLLRQLHEGRPGTGADCRPDAAASGRLTGSPLSAEGYEWIYRHVKDDLLLDPRSAAAPTSQPPSSAPVRSCRYMPARCSARGLGIAVYALDEPGNKLQDDGRRTGGHRAHAIDAALLLERRRQQALPGQLLRRLSRPVWRHGDWLRITPAAAPSSTAAPTPPSTATASAWARPSSIAWWRICRKCWTAWWWTSNTWAAQLHAAVRGAARRRDAGRR
jgi:acetoacetyl-CoA synthetase